MTHEQLTEANRLTSEISQLNRVKAMLEGSGADNFDDVIYKRIPATAMPIFDEGIKFIISGINARIDLLNSKFKSL